MFQFASAGPAAARRDHQRRQQQPVGHEDAQASVAQVAQQDADAQRADEGGRRNAREKRAA